MLINYKGGLLENVILCHERQNYSIITQPAAKHDYFPLLKPLNNLGKLNADKFQYELKLLLIKQKIKIITWVNKEH